MLKKISIAFGLLSSALLVGSDSSKKQHGILVSHFRWQKNPVYIATGVINFDKDSLSYYGANTGARNYYENYDLGQTKSITHFDGQYQQDVKAAAAKKRVLFGLHDSAATITNWLAQKKPAEQKKAASALVLLDGLSNGNHSSVHTAGMRQYIAPLSFLPFARLWLPYVAKAIALPSYNPRGVQALNSAKKLDPSLPVIIIHDREQPDFPINDARQYYLNLRASGNQQAYLMESGETNGINIKHLQAIYQKHDLPVNETIGTEGVQPADLAKYQPAPDQVLKSMRHSYDGRCELARNVIDIACGAAIVAGIYYKCAKK